MVAGSIAFKNFGKLVGVGSIVGKENKLDVLALKILVQRFHFLDGLTAGRTPRIPNVHQNDLALEPVETTTPKSFAAVENFGRRPDIVGILQIGENMLFLIVGEVIMVLIIVSAVFPTVFVQPLHPEHFDEIVAESQILCKFRVDKAASTVDASDNVIGVLFKILLSGWQIAKVGIKF